jgi:UDP-N-acetyl-D-mannosaminuronate dehydrogenase
MGALDGLGAQLPRPPRARAGDGRRDLERRELDDALVAAQDVVVILADHSALDTARLVASARRLFDTRNATRDVAAGRENVWRL